MGHAATVGFLLSALSFVGIIFCVVSSEWKRNSPIASQQSLQNIYYSEGLWMRCSIPTAGNLQCDNYGTTLFDVPSFLQILRALTILAVISMFVACVMDCLAMDCVNCVTSKQQIWMARIGGVFSIVAGAMIIAAVSWYAAEVVRQFNIFTNINYGSSGAIKYTFGAALYVGWVAGGIGLISGSITLCCSCFSDEDEHEEYRYTYKAPKAEKTSTEYV